jgi:hypothetical protein
VTLPKIAGSVLAADSRRTKKCTGATGRAFLEAESFGRRPVISTVIRMMIMNHRLATLLEVTLVFAVCLSMLRYVPPLGLLLPSIYVSARVVTRSLRNGNVALTTLARTGAGWSVAVMLSFGLATATIMIGHRIYTADPSVAVDFESWLPAIFVGFVVLYGGMAAVIGGLIGACSGAYARLHSRQASH